MIWVRRGYRVRRALSVGDRPVEGSSSPGRACDLVFVKQDVSDVLFFDFEIKSFLPRETELEFKLPDDFFKLTQSATPRCYLRGKNKMLKSCVANEVVNDMRIKMTLMDDFAADLPITLEFFGHVNFDKTGFTAANNKIGPFSAKATYNTKVLAQTPAAPLVEFTINDAVSSLASPVAAQLLPTPTVVIDPINEAERALYNFTVDFRQVINILE